MTLEQFIKECQDLIAESKASGEQEFITLAKISGKLNGTQNILNWSK